MEEKVLQQASKIYAENDTKKILEDIKNNGSQKSKLDDFVITKDCLGRNICYYIKILTKTGKFGKYEEQSRFFPLLYRKGKFSRPDMAEDVEESEQLSIFLNIVECRNAKELNKTKLRLLSNYPNRALYINRLAKDFANGSF